MAATLIVAVAMEARQEALQQKPPTPPPPAVVPDLFGRTEQEARGLLARARLSVGDVSRAEADFRPGTVFKQNYAPGAKLRPGTPVNFVLALRPQVKLVTVPDLFSASEAKARDLLHNVGLKAGRVTRAEARARPDTVFRQEYPAGAKVTEGTAVGFVLAVPVRPPPVPMTIVPDLFGASDASARDLLLSADLRIGEVTRAEANARPGTVFKQEYRAGAQVMVGTAVGFVLALPINDPVTSGRGGRGGGGTPPVKLAIVPDLFGANEENARGLLLNAGLQAGEVTKAEANNKPFTVFKQDYPAGAQVTAGTAVGFVLAVPITVEVPPVVGSTQGTAVAILRKYTLQLGRITDEQSRLPKGQVLTQGIPAGTKVPAGSAVDLTVAVPITLAVPPLRLLPESDAVALLKKRELAVGDITTEESRAPTGSVIAQRPAPGTVVEIGTRVNFVVAKPITVDVPPLVSRLSDDAADLLKKIGLTVGNVTSEESRRTPDSVLSQAPAAGTKVSTGTAVSFVIARSVTVPVPNVVSMQQADARRTLIASELAIGSAKTEEARVLPGSVLRQSIAAGRRVTIGTAIDLVMATRVTVLVPRIAGLKEAAALAALAAAELKPGVQYQESPAEPGTVLTQSIDPDTNVPIETLVPFVVSAVETVPMPSVVGITKEEARQRLLAGRLSIGGEPLRPVRSELRDLVLAQSVETGTRIPIGTAIVLTVSTPEMVAVPRVIDRPRGDAFTEITSAGLKVGEVTRGFSFSRAGGTIVGQGLSPGVRVEFGTALAVEEALPRMIWAGPAAGFIAVAGLVGLRKRLRNKIPGRQPSETAKAVPPVDVSAKANIHVVETNVRTDDARPIKAELRIVPTAGSTAQDITAGSGNIIKSERRGPRREGANEEGTS